MGYDYTIKDQATHIMITFTTTYHLDTTQPNLNQPLADTYFICFLCNPLCLFQVLGTVFSTGGHLLQAGLGVPAWWWGVSLDVDVIAALKWDKYKI